MYLTLTAMICQQKLLLHPKMLLLSFWHSEFVLLEYLFLDSVPHLILRHRLNLQTCFLEGAFL